MKRFKIFLNFIFVLLFLCNNITAQTIQIEKLSLNKANGWTKPTFQHSALTTIDDGFSLIYSINGFASLGLGEISLNYKTNGDSYCLATGLGNLLSGINKSVLKYKDATLFLNSNFGITFKAQLLYSVGLSYNQKIGISSQLEIATDIFSHPGSSYAYATVNANYTRGVVGSVTYSHNILDYLSASFTVGAEYMKYRYIEYCGGYYEGECGVYYYSYISLEQENNQFFKSIKDKKLEWEEQPIAFTLNIAISYHF